MKITVLSPHRDDAAFSIGLAIETWVALGHAVEVINCFTKSTYGPFGDLECVHAEDLKSYVTALRHREDVVWSNKYSRAVSLMDLNLEDAPRRRHCTVEEVCSVLPRLDDDSLIKIRIALEQTVSGALILPLGLGDHVDHLTARMAAQNGWPEALPVAFYEDLPYAARPGIANQIQWRALTVAPGLVAGFACGPTDLTDATARKRDFALCYGSQVDAEAVEQISQYCMRYDGRERLWMNWAWLQSGLGA